VEYAKSARLRAARSSHPTRARARWAEPLRAGQPSALIGDRTMTAPTTVAVLYGAKSTLDVRDSYGTPLFPAGPFESPASTRVTFGVNPATGSTVTEMPATPDAGTPTS